MNGHTPQSFIWMLITSLILQVWIQPSCEGSAPFLELKENVEFQCPEEGRLFYREPKPSIIWLIRCLIEVTSEGGCGLGSGLCFRQEEEEAGSANNCLRSKMRRLSQAVLSYLVKDSTIVLLTWNYRAQAPIPKRS